MSNSISYDIPTDGYTSSGDLTPTPGGYNGGQENDRSFFGTLWHSFVVSTMTWDTTHWVIGPGIGLMVSVATAVICRSVCPQRGRLCVILAIMGFLFGLWAYYFCLVVMISLGLLAPALFVCYFFCCTRCYYLLCVRPWAISKERRRMFLQRTLSNPTWRRRSWLVVLRARRIRDFRARGRCSTWSVFRRNGARGRCVLPLNNVVRSSFVIGSSSSRTDYSFQQVVMNVIDLPEEELFRGIIYYI